MNRFLLAAIVATTLFACSRPSYPGSEPYPVPPGDPVPGDPRYPERSRIPGETRYPNPNPSGDNSTQYPVEGQRDGVVTVIKTGDINAEHLPPGQAKKKYGGKSAKVYAPGQVKKQGGSGKVATVISVADQYASRSTSGQLYYIYRDRTYWKQNDGYYYLDTRYDKTGNIIKDKDDKVKDDDDDDDDDDDEKDKKKKKGKGKGKSRNKGRS